MRKLIAMLALVATLAGVSVVAAAAPASAGAFGCSLYGPGMTIRGVGVRKGTYCVEINGAGTWVSYVYAQANINNAILGTTCNYRMTAEFFDGNGSWYETLSSPTRYGCFSAAGASERINVGRNMRKGMMCSTLISNGARETSVCHSIK